jgi:HK97 family phage prohead protease
VSQHFRAFGGPLERADPHTLEGRLVPWSEPTVVAELDEEGRPDRYTEIWERGAFDTQVRSDNTGVIRKIALRDEHIDGLGKIGWALQLQDRDDGLWGKFRVREAALADVSQMYEDGIDGLSIGFHPLRAGTRIEARGTADERRYRSKAYINHVALVATPAYDGARVMALRDADELVADSEADHARTQFLAEIDSWLVDNRQVRVTHVTR